MDLQELKQLYINGVYKSKALLVREEPFTLQSGRKSHIYLNHRNFLAQSEYLILVAKIYWKLIQEVIQEYKLGVVDSVMSPIIVGALSGLASKNLVVIKSAKLEHGTKEDIYGDCSGEIVIIDDMTSTGGMIIEAAQKIRKSGGSINYAIVSACRDQTAKDNLAKENIKLLSIATFDEIIAGLRSQLTNKEKELITKEHGALV